MESERLMGNKIDSPRPDEFRFDQSPESTNKLELKEKKEWGLKDFKGFIHFHSWEGSSCGREKIDDIVKAVKSKTGLDYIGFNEHVGWPGEEYWSDKILKEFANIDQIQKENPELKIFKGIEVNVLKDGSIDGTDLLPSSDLVVASHHYKNIEPQIESTAEATKDRWLKLMDDYPEVNVLGHPFRDLPEKEWPNVDWDAICTKAKEKNVIIEVGISDSAVDKLPTIFLEALAINGNLVAFDPDFHHLVNHDVNLDRPHFQKKDNWLGHRVKDLTDEQRAILGRYHELKGKIAGKTFNEGDMLKGRKIDEPILSTQEEQELIKQLQDERKELAQIESSDNLKEIYDILILSEKEILTNGKEKEKFPLSVSTLMRFGRRMDRVRKTGIKKENLVNTWDKKELSKCEI